MNYTPRFLIGLALGILCWVNALAAPDAKPGPEAEISAFYFVAGTPVITEDGSKPIEKIKDGDKVWATEPLKRKSGYYKVAHIVPLVSNQLVEVATAGRDRIVCAPSQPFWVNQKGWVAAKTLFPGDQLLQRDGTFVKVFNVIPQRGPKTPVYNLEVEGLPTSYVGKPGVLVQN